MTGPPAGRGSASCRAMRDFSRMSCVAINSEAPCRCVASSNRSATREQASSSRLDVGSSASSSLGRLTRARAMATRCCWPTESWCGNASTRSLTPRDRSMQCRRTIDWQSGDALGDQQILQRGQGGQQMELLQHDADVLAAEAVARRGESCREILPIDQDPAAALAATAPQSSAGASSCRSPTVRRPGHCSWRQARIRPTAGRPQSLR